MRFFILAVLLFTIMGCQKTIHEVRRSPNHQTPLAWAHP